MSMKILVTGGAGYIGTHTLIELIENGYEPIVFYNFVNSSEKSLQLVQQITGKKYLISMAIYETMTH